MSSSRGPRLAHRMCVRPSVQRSNETPTLVKPSTLQSRRTLIMPEFVIMILRDRNRRQPLERAAAGTR